MASYNVTAPATPTVSRRKESRWRCSSSSSTNDSAAPSPTAVSITAPPLRTRRPANLKPPTTAPTRPFNRSSISLPPDALRLFDSSCLRFSGLESSSAPRAGARLRCLEGRLWGEPVEKRHGPALRLREASGRCRLGQATFAGTDGKGREAPFPDARRSAEPLRSSTDSGPSSRPPHSEQCANFRYKVMSLRLGVHLSKSRSVVSCVFRQKD